VEQGGKQQQAVAAAGGANDHERFMQGLYVSEGA
jgi:hypothetical protein